MEAEDPETLVTRVPFRYTSYPVTATLSVEAVQESVKLVPVILEAVNEPGTDGDCESGVVTLRLLLEAEKFPAASFAYTVMV